MHLSRLRSEIKRIVDRFGIEPARPIPERVKVVDKPADLHALSSLSPHDRTLLISKELENHISYVIKKEAFSLFIHVEADKVPQVHDLAWIYSGAHHNLWNKIRKKPNHPFTNYDPSYMFSLVERRKREEVLRDLLLAVRASSERGQLTFPLYMALLNFILGKKVRLTDSDLKVIEAISANPYASTKAIKESTGVSESSISRSINKLRKMGYLFGPENVSLWDLDLVTIVARFPNIRGYREAFWRFPYTYTQLIPLSAKADVHAYLVFPREGIKSLGLLRQFNVRCGIVKKTAQGINLRPIDDAIGEMLRAYNLSKAYPGDARIEIRKPPIKLTREDLRALNLVLREGRVSSSMLSRMGVKSAKQRLSNLRKGGLIRNYYMIGSLWGMRIMLMRLRCGLDEIIRLKETLLAASSVIISYVEGEESFCLAISLVPPELKMDFMMGVKVIYGDELDMVEETYSIHPLWLIPVDLWDAKAKTFRWEVPLERLVTDLSSAS